MPILVAACTILLALCALLGGSSEEILGVLPAILLLVGLALGRYPGEEKIFRLIRSHRRRPRAAAAVVPRPRTADFPGRIVLLAASQPLRGPPALLSVSS